MQYKKFGDTYAVRLEKGEEVVAAIKGLCEKEQIRLGTVTGLGAADRIVIGLFNTVEKKYYSTTYTEPMEMTALCGNVTEMDGQIYLHFHANFGRAGGAVIGGQRKALQTGKDAAARFLVVDDEAVAAFAYCNLHGLWKTPI